MVQTWLDITELLAPETCVFYDSQWRILGIKLDLKHFLSRTTGIHEDIFYGIRPATVASVSTKKFWASQRQTTRPEDLAYSLLGLFEVNTPLLYGEGGVKTFVRLQMQIINRSDDDSIFAWMDLSEWGWFGLLAPSPRVFASCRFVQRSLPDFFGFKEPYTMMHRGLRLRRFMRRIEVDDDMGGSIFAVLGLACRAEEPPPDLHQFKYFSEQTALQTPKLLV